MNIADKFRLDGKVALVTGASKGIGEAMARAMAQAGAKVVICSRKQEAVEEVAYSLTKDGFEAIGIAANVGRVGDIHMLIDKTLQRYGTIDVLVNNAAVNPVFGPIVQADVAAFDKIMDVNLKGPFELSKAVYPHMVKRGGGSIINISSIEGISPEKFMGIYSVSKAALIMLTKVMAKEWGTDKVRVNAICPGLIQTKFSETLWNNENILNMVLSHVPMARMGQSEEMAGLALFLASDASSYCTGGVYAADGGYTI